MFMSEEREKEGRKTTVNSSYWLMEKEWEREIWKEGGNTVKQAEKASFFLIRAHAFAHALTSPVFFTTSLDRALQLFFYFAELNFVSRILASKSWLIVYGGKVLGSNHLLLLPQLTLKVVKLKSDFA